MRAPLKRYYLKSILPFLLFIGLIVVAYVLEPSAHKPVAKVGLAMLPMLPLLRLFWLHLRYLSECDELERKIEMDAMAVSSMAGMLVGFGLMLLHDFQVLNLSTREMLSVLVLVIAVTYIVIRGIGIWRFRA
ncbi:MAG: hypothetical protein ACOVKN_05590 [Arenimonas sp.]|jgi:hypothetical protein